MRVLRFCFPAAPVCGTRVGIECIIITSIGYGKMRRKYITWVPTYLYHPEQNMCAGTELDGPRLSQRIR